jgi:hypothetical protein
MYEKNIGGICKLDKSWIYVKVIKGLDLYTLLEDAFNKLGDAVVSIDMKIIFYNNEKITDWTDHMFLSVEAHEIAHWICGHYDVHDMPDINEEIEADIIGIYLLNHLIYYESAYLLSKRLIELHNIDYTIHLINDSTLDKYNKYIKTIS